MFYLKFVGNEGAEHNICGYAYNIQPKKDNSILLTVNIKDLKGTFEKSFTVGDGADWLSVFIMNISGQTIDKHCFIKK